MPELLAMIVRPPDMLGYDELPDGLEARAALPARFHTVFWPSGAAARSAEVLFPGQLPTHARRLAA